MSLKYGVWSRGRRKEEGQAVEVCTPWRYAHLACLGRITMLVSGTCLGSSTWPQSSTVHAPVQWLVGSGSARKHDAVHVCVRVT